MRGSGLSKQPIGVFDSGVGGLSILRDLRIELPFDDFVYTAGQITLVSTGNRQLLAQAQ